MDLTPARSALDQSTTCNGKDCVIVVIGASLSITYTGNISPFLDLHLLYVLVVPHLTNNLLLVCKLTYDFPLFFTFTNNFFTVQNHKTGRLVATCKCDGVLYVLECGNSSFILILKKISSCIK